MKYFGKLMMAGIVLGIVISTGNISAGELPKSNPLVKLGRGVSNVAFGPLELLIRPYDVNHTMGGIPALTYGVFSGILHTVVRECVGVFEIATFYMPLPGCSDDPLETGTWGYGPILYPEWVVDTEHNAFNFFYPKDSIVAP
ncbi:MAG: exosortase system-associated protein, TIGR04073 family [Victivallaceae bacterium]|jgi:putative exosortase-associated protein (TIGR04073 family)|nr:exosortase system-associated protein, TIGR04073 family [Victivallaceae bacterium]NLK84269.1 exosortase system-associated protein, TIGR04073 family [Lentisphaerota bacterium]MDD3116413.1 exosortase system-associated protein, TIGR04073 family [Victivallaceae bacterium]MDD3704437.1 exosortase system-associated protein, TIGR04073 family [Victivallaceae bacterium]MDD4317764.1 exosortase system-associated protein, TIGR04073 family [Victivallaceae bacterium]